MTQDRKYFGMTTTQLAILAGLAIAACLLFGVAGILVLRGGPSGFAPAPQATPIPQSTATTFVLPTLTPTETLTPVPYEQLIPQGWVQFKTPLIEIWLPKGFKKNKPTADKSGLTTELTLMGYASKASIYPTGVIVSYEPIVGETLDAYINDLPSQLSNEVRLTEKGKVSINSVEAIRLMLEMKVEGVDFNDLIFAFQDGGTVWAIQYLAPINDYYTMLDTFDKSIKTFRIVR